MAYRSSSGRTCGAGLASFTHTSCDRGYVWASTLSIAAVNHSAGVSNTGISTEMVGASAGHSFRRNWSSRAGEGR
ncbi:MAG: hypothetical protein ABGY75_01375 [Gemmataceae bacterium]